MGILGQENKGESCKHEVVGVREVDMADTQRQDSLVTMKSFDGSKCLTAFPATRQIIDEDDYESSGDLDEEDLLELKKERAVQIMCVCFNFRKEPFHEEYDLFVPDKNRIKGEFREAYMKHKFHKSIDEMDSAVLQDYYCFLQHDLQNCVGYSFNGQIRECVNRKTGVHYAVKLYHMDPENFHELHVLYRLRDCPYTINMKEMFDYREYRKAVSSDRDWNEYELFLVMDLIPGGCLDKQLQRTLAVKSPLPLTEPQAKEVFHQMLLSVEAIHARDIIHRDINPGHFILNQNFDQLVLGGFSISVDKTLSRYARKFVLFGMGKFYTAPEIRKSPDGAGFSSDIWSLGAILYELLVGVSPDGDERLFQKLAATSISEEAKDLLRAMLSLDPSARPLTFAIRSFPWMHDVQVDPNLEFSQDPILATKRREFQTCQLSKEVMVAGSEAVLSVATPRIQFLSSIVSQRVLGFAELATGAHEYQAYAQKHQSTCQCEADVYACG